MNDFATVVSGLNFHYYRDVYLFYDLHISSFDSCFPREQTLKRTAIECVSANSGHHFCVAGYIDVFFTNFISATTD